MENFQIEDNVNSINIILTKGHVRVSLFASSKMNVMTFEERDTIRQMQIIPRMLYRFLSYEDKDLRFGSKFISFSDQNFYDKNVKQEKKSIKYDICYKKESHFYQILKRKRKTMPGLKIFSSPSKRDTQKSNKQSNFSKTDLKFLLASLKKSILLKTPQIKFIEIKLWSSLLMMAIIMKMCLV